jgi:hypothetical protein
VPVTASDFEAISPNLPSHQEELLVAHSGQPSTEVQNATHGSPSPQPDHGTDDRAKYAQ